MFVKKNNQFLNVKGALYNMLGTVGSVSKYKTITPPTPPLSYP